MKRSIKRYTIDKINIENGIKMCGKLCRTGSKYRVSVNYIVRKLVMVD